MANLVIPFQKLGKHDVEIVGGKNASLGEMISNLANAGVSVPGGFATTAQAYRDFLEQSGLNKRIHDVLDQLNVDDVVALAEAGRKIRQWVVETPLLPALEQEVRAAFDELTGGNENTPVAVRSSATAEDLPDASFAGQQETFLNVIGADEVLHKMKEVFASLYNDRAISYRVHKGFAHAEVALSSVEAKNQFVWFGGNRDVNGTWGNGSPIDPLWGSVPGYSTLVLGDFVTQAKTESVYLKMDNPSKQPNLFGADDDALNINADSFFEKCASKYPEFQERVQSEANQEVSPAGKSATKTFKAFSNGI